MLKNLKKINFKKSLFYLSAFILIFNASMFSAFFNSPDSKVKAEDMCQVAVDVILIMDVSGSMEEGATPSKCEWRKYEPSYCVSYTQENVTENWCAEQESDPPCPGYTFTPATESKINNAKDAANSFLDNMGANDQSGLVSFSDNASLVKGLNNNHNDTKNSVNGLIAYGSTNIGEAINFATTELDNHQNGQAVKAMILLTDGKANEPNGDGYHENQQDVQYAIDQANLAGQKNYKIFTVGLGNDGEINESMLQQIANDTGANYHHAPNGTDLSDIYNDIAYEICQYGSISGCKYNDLNNNGTIDIGEPTIQNWQVALNNGTATTTQTISNGCYTFAGLTDNTYNVSETVPDGWIQTVPNNPNFYTVEILNHNNITDKDFANYYPECSNNILDAGEQCDDGNIIAGDGCSAICEIETPEPTYQCSDEIDNDGDQLIDYPNDPGCENLTDNDETNQQEPPAGIQQGDIVINEIMQNPDAVNDSVGEWFELYNISNKNLDLQNCTISDNNSDNHTINSSLLVGPNEYLTLVRGSWNSSLNGGISPDYVYYSGFTLGNADDEIILTCNGTEIDRVEYDGGLNWPNPVGKSMILADPNLDNNVGANWCVSTSVYGDGDLGTPGTQNDSCGAGPICDSSISGAKYQGENKLSGWTIELYDSQNNLITSDTTDSNGEYIFENLCGGTYIIKEVQQLGWEQVFPVDASNNPINYTENLGADEELRNRDFSNYYAGACGNNILDNGEQCDDGNINNNDGCSNICQSEVIINELMWMGSATSTADEWIELYNSTQNPIDLSACKITKNGSDMIPETEFAGKNILANGYFIISNWDKNQSFINIDPDIIDSSISLNNSDAQYKLICNNIVIDTADDGNGTPLAGALKEDGWYNRSMSRKSPAVDGTATGSWCDAGTKYNLDGDRDEYATPGAINVCKEDAENPGSLKICKYEDADGDYLNTTNDQTALADWAFQIFNGITTSTATTTIDGCVIIENLIPGDYRITENIKNNWYIASANRQGHTFNIVQNQETRVDFYNTEYSTIYGYKYEDLDNSTSTDEYLQNPVKGWTINLFDNSATSTPLFFTSTDQSGYFEFNNLIPGVYIISEETQNGWTALSATSTFFTLFSGTATSTNFINYFESGTGGPEPEQKTETSDSGGSNFITRPDLKLDFEYLTEKNIDLSYTEKIIITNTGNIILTNGTLSVNLPENKLKFIDTGLNSAAFNIAALGVDNTFIATFTVTAIGEGEAITNVNINFDQISDKGQMIETITSANGVGNGPEKQETVTKTPAETQAIQPQSQGQTGNIQGEAAGTGETEQKIEQKNLPEIKGDQIFEIKDINGSGCVWWNWLLIIFLFIIVNGGYFLIMRENE